MNKKIIEATLFLRGDIGVQPIELKEVLGLTLPETRELFDQFMDDVNNDNARGIFITKYVDVYKIATKKELKNKLAKFVSLNKKKRLSDSAMETMAVIAYKQPLTKSEITNVRRINSDGVVNTLLSKGLIEEVGVSDKAGKGILFGVTNKFYDYFQLKTLKDLPEMEELNLQNDVKDSENTDSSISE